MLIKIYNENDPKLSMSYKYMCGVVLFLFCFCLFLFCFVLFCFVLFCFVLLFCFAFLCNSFCSFFPPINSGKVEALAYSARSKQLFSAGDDTRIVVWNMDADRKEVCRNLLSRCCAGYTYT